MAADEGKQLGEGIRLILEELKDLKRELLKYSQRADEDRRQADVDRAAFMSYIAKTRETDRLDRQALSATLNTLVRQHAVLADILVRQGAKLDQGNEALGEIRDLLRRAGNGGKSNQGNGHPKA